MSTLTSFDKIWHMIFESLQRKYPLGYPFLRMVITKSNLDVNFVRRIET